MNSLQHYKELLEKELQELQEVLSKHGFVDPQNQNDFVAQEVVDENQSDNIDNADFFEEKENEQVDVEMLEDRYKEVVDALARIESGTYGRDTVTGEPIDPKRLEVNPAARTNI